MRTQLLTNEKDRHSFCLGRLITFRLVSDETLGEIPHLWSGSAHLKMCSRGAAERFLAAVRLIHRLSGVFWNLFKKRRHNTVAIFLDDRLCDRTCASHQVSE